MDRYDIVFSIQSKLSDEERKQFDWLLSVWNKDEFAEYKAPRNPKK
jgi:hypothetical protein